VAIVMGLDQHRAQITADWLDTDTGEVRRARIVPAHRGEVRRFLAPRSRSWPRSALTFVAGVPAARGARLNEQAVTKADLRPVQPGGHAPGATVVQRARKRSRCYGWRA
jgi:hypothetical protein